MQTKLRLLEMLAEKPSPSGDISARLGVSRMVLERLVRKGLLKTTWGAGGVGVFFNLTKSGLEQLKRLKAASVVDTRVTRRKMILLKTIAPLLTG